MGSRILTDPDTDLGYVIDALRDAAVDVTLTDGRLKVTATRPPAAHIVELIRARRDDLVRWHSPCRCGSTAVVLHDEHGDPWCRLRAQAEGQRLLALDAAGIDDPPAEVA